MNSRETTIPDSIELRLSGDFHVKPGWKYGPVGNDCHQIVYFPAGSGSRYASETINTVLGKPCVIVTPPGERHSYEFDPERPVRHLFITFACHAVKESLPCVLKREESLCIHSVEETFVPALISQILYLSSRKLYLWRERSRLLLMSVLAELEGLRGMESSPQQSPVLDSSRSLPVHKALDYIDKHLEEPLTIAKIAEEVGWTHGHFTRKFTQMTGMPPQKAILMRRIERACQLLVQETWSISEIAYAVGFQNIHYFYRVFSSIKGITAGEYRKKFTSPHLQRLSVAEDSRTPHPANRYFLYDSNG